MSNTSEFVTTISGSMKALLRLRGIADARILACMYCARESL
jgi:hypothetical protein